MEGNNSQADQEDNFKPIFKKYKRRDKRLDLTEVTDLELLTDSCSSLVEHVKPIVPGLTPVVGLKPVQDWSIFHFPRHPGFFLIQNPFLPGSQQYWASRCLQDLPRPPNVTNLTVHPDLNPDTLWEAFVSDFQHRGHEAYNSSSPLRKLRWTTIGYHYHWDTKEYKEDDHTPFPEDVGVLAHYVACVLGFPEFQAEAGIINYYHHDSSLAAHTDHSELDHDAPLISVSFGQDAIFLMGGPTKAQTPTAVRLHSGDICVMSGDARLAFHAVPRILPSPSSSPPPCFDMTPDDWKRVEDWVGDVGDTQGCVRDMPVCIGDTVGFVGDPASCDRHTLLTMSAEGIPSATEPHAEHSLPASTSSLERDSYTSSGDGSFLISTTAHHGDCSEENVHSQSSAKNDENTSALQVECSSQDNELSSVSESSLSNNTTSTHHTDSPSVESNSHGNHSFSNPTSPQQEEGLLRQSNPQVYEEKVKGVNCQLVTTLKTQDWKPFAAYLSSSRLNVNIRQVLKAGHSFRTASRQDSPVQVKKPRTDIPL